MTDEDQDDGSVKEVETERSVGKEAQVSQVTDDESESSEDEAEHLTEQAESHQEEVKTIPLLLPETSDVEVKREANIQSSEGAPVEGQQKVKKIRLKTKHNWYTVPEINRILDSYRGSNMSRRKFCALMKVPESSLRRWETRPVPKGEPARRQAKYPKIEDEVHRWFKDERENGVSISNVDLRRKAQEIAVRDNITGFDASHGWVGKLKERKKIKTFDARFSSFKESNEASSGEDDATPHKRDKAARTVKVSKGAGPVAKRKSKSDQSTKGGKSNEKLTPTKKLTGILKKTSKIK